MRVYIGIDPGLSGAVAVLHGNGELVFFDTPTTQISSGKKNKNVYIENKMTGILKGFVDYGVHVMIEKQQSMPKQGLSSTFQTGYGYGVWIGIINALGYPYTIVTSQRWKKVMMDGMGKEKAASCVRAQQLYPDAELFTPRRRALDGRGNAALIATYLKQTYNK
jgi:crossover junction endodeoxyribonuclease RuvC